MALIPIALKSILCLIAVSVVTSTATAAPRWVEDAAYDPAIPTPESFFGRQLGEQHASVEEIIGYSRQLAEASDRAELIQYGNSVEGDPLHLLVIRSPEHRELLERRPGALAVVRDPWQHGATARQRATDELLPLTWVACSIHGDEASGSDAGLMLAYHLAADQSASTRDILDRSIVIIDPCQNPDGRRRFLNHIRSFRRQIPGPDADRAAMEHTQLWPGGRRNHYLFDLNRDWAFLTQRETRARAAEFLKWRPQVFVDLHEMGRESTYFFPPPTDPVNPNVPLEQREWWDVFGRANSRAFDEHGFDYFVREAFDLFYPGYGDSWPTLQGAIGMTYEQSTTRGLMMRNSSGDLLHYQEAVRRHFVAALTTCATAARNDRELMDSYRRTFDLAREESRRHDVAELVLITSARPGQTASLVQTLVRQGIDVFRTTEPAELKVRDYVTGEQSKQHIPAGSFRVPYGQPAFPLVRSLLDLHTPMDEHFLAQERQRRERGLHNRFYDVTAWSLVLAYGATAFVSSNSLDVDSEPVTVAAASPGRLVASGEGTPYAWLIPYDDNTALRAMARLLWRDVALGVMEEPFTQAGRRYPRGTLVIKRVWNDHVEDLATVLAEVANHSGTTVWETASAWTDEGPSLGSGKLLRLTAPRIALLSGPGTEPASVGALRWILEVRYEIPYTFMLIDSVKDTELFDFDTLIVPQLRGSVDLDTERLDRWVAEGGTLVTVGSASTWLLEQEGEWSTAEVITDLRDLKRSEEPGSTEKDQSEGKPQDSDTTESDYVPPEHRPDRTPGAIVRLEVDTHHVLTIGEEEIAFAPLFSNRLLRPSKDGKTLATYARENPRVAGFMWPNMEDAIPGLAFAVHESKGRGSVVLFAEDPSFRGTWEGLDRLLLNSVLLGTSLKP